MTTRQPKYTEPKNLENDEYTACFKYINLAMKIFGVFPLFPIHEITNVSKLLSTILTIFSISIYFVFVAEALTPAYADFVNLLRNFNFLKLIAFVPRAVLLLLVLCAPCFTWNKNNHQRNYRNKWMLFQKEVEKITRTSYKCPLKNKIQSAFAMGTICMSIITILIKTRKWNESQPASTAMDFLRTLYIFNGTASTMTYWVVNNMYTKSMAEKIENLVQRTMSEVRDVDLRHLINLWITLCDLNEEFINIHSILFLLLFCLTTIMGIVSAFTAIFLFVNIPDKSLGFTYFSGTMICILSLMTFCEIANSVTKHITYKLRKTLLSENVINKNTHLLQMILLFLQTIETKNPQITFNGYMILDRSMVPLILGTSINFLIVLKQFSPG